MTRSQAALELVDVEKGYQEGGRRHTVLSDLNLRLEPGDFIALLGPSGSGKSTLLNLISGIDGPDRGEIRVAGVDLHGLSERDRTLFRRDHVGFVFQFFNLIPTLTVEENLLLPLELAGRTRDEDRERVRRLLGRVGLEDRAGAWPDRLSGGEQQRVAVARSLAHQPSLVLADEPTGNLDQATGTRVLDLLEELVRDSGTTMVMVTHSENAAARADRIYDLNAGRLELREPRPA
ncbi:MAG: ABC transporter ATP-binding protein [Gemmatimonadales bacterium]|nr:MAG: ABC transporter ATP-binding protein [Gemmatimonadales bacterium]